MEPIFDTSKELQKIVSRPHVLEANAFKGKKEVPLTRRYADGSTFSDTFTIVKGFDEEKEALDPKTANYVILFKPEEAGGGTWLKIVHPDTSNTPQQHKELSDRLITSAAIAKAACNLIDLPYLADQTKVCDTLLLGKSLVGFTTPHIGPSAGYLLERWTGHQRPTKLQGEIATFFTEVYLNAFNQSIDLLLKHGYFMDDPNVGNILFHAKDDDSIQVVLIDFSNSHQIMSPIHAPPIPQGRYSDAETARRSYRSASGYLINQADSLFTSFRNVTDKFGITLPYDEIRDRLRVDGLRIAQQYQNPYVFSR